MKKLSAGVLLCWCAATALAQTPVSTEPGALMKAPAEAPVPSANSAGATAGSAEGAVTPVTALPDDVEKKLLEVSTPQTDIGISGHEPTYITLGGNWHGEGDYGAKFQISLKFRVLNPENPKQPDWSEKFYFGYTQTSVWDLEAASKPFRDSSYRPEVFWDDPGFSPLPSVETLAGLRLGLGHESNGKEGLDSRSINIAYVRPVFTFVTTQRGYVWSFAPKLYGYLDRSDNPDIADYRGFGDFLFKVRKDDKWQFSATLRKGTQSDYGSVQLDASYPFRGFLRQLNGYLYVQYFNGYGETILDYNLKLPSHIGIGLIVVR